MVNFPTEDPKELKVFDSAEGHLGHVHHFLDESEGFVAVTVDKKEPLCITAMYSEGLTNEELEHMKFVFLQTLDKLIKGNDDSSKG